MSEQQIAVKTCNKLVLSLMNVMQLHGMCTVLERY